MNKSSLKIRITTFISTFMIWGLLRFFLIMKIKMFCFNFFTIDSDVAQTLFSHFLIILEAFLLFILYYIYQKSGWLEPIRIKARNFYILGIIVGIGIFISAFPVVFHYQFKIFFEFPFIKIIGNIFSNAGEEFIYRGLLFASALSLFRSSTIAIILSSLAFGAGHWDLPYLFQAYSALVGIILGLLYHKVKNLTIPYVSHTVADILTESFFH